LAPQFSHCGRGRDPATQRAKVGKFPPYQVPLMPTAIEPFLAPFRIPQGVCVLEQITALEISTLTRSEYSILTTTCAHDRDCLSIWKYVEAEFSSVLRTVRNSIGRRFAHATCPVRAHRFSRVLFALARSAFALKHHLRLRVQQESSSVREVGR
jgi:hypothetical protein